MKLINDLLNPINICEDAAVFLLKQLNVKFTTLHLKNELKGHPDYPSLLCIADVLSASYKISTIPIKVDQNKIPAIAEIPTPFFVHMKSTIKGQLLSVVTKFTEKEIEVYNPEIRKIELLSIEKFEDRFLGSILYVEVSEDSKEKEFEQHFKVERQLKNINNVIKFTLPTISLLICIYLSFTNPASLIIPPILLTITTLVGCFITILLLWQEIDSFNPALKKICQINKKVNCDAILNSKAAKIFGISWSSIGFSYFCGILMTFLIGGLSNVTILYLLAGINLLVLPYVFYSIFYQWRIAKQWCLLCLLVQAVIVLQFIINIISGYIVVLRVDQSTIITSFSVLGSFGFSVTAILIIIPALQKAKTGIEKSTELRQLKYNPIIFEALLKKERCVPMPLSGIGITIGNPIGKFKIIKVCNPYCGPCASAHPTIHSLLENRDDVCVQIIFPATENKNDMRKKPISHFLAIDSKNNKQEIFKALDDWYSAPIKDYNRFYEKYPIGEELFNQNDKVKLMLDWCENVEIKFTPTFFLCLNSQVPNPELYELPQNYDLIDLNYLFQND